MIIDEVKKMLEAAKKADQVVIVGAGKNRNCLMALLRNEGISVKEIFDNNDALAGTMMDGVLVQKPHCFGAGTIYIVDVKSDDIATALINQLVSLGIAKDEVIRQPQYIVPDDIDIEDLTAVQNALDEVYCGRFGHYIDWESPKTYNEIINYEKVFERDSRKRDLADKYKVRDYVKSKIGEKYLTKLYGVWDNPDDIDFDGLPKEYVLKTNNGSSRNIVVTKDNPISIDDAKEKLEKWLVSDYWKGFLEYQYKDIKPMIICEEYLHEVANSIGEYKLYCFHGQAKYIGYERASHLPGWSSRIYTPDWQVLDFSYAIPLDEAVINRPDNLNEMINIGNKLSEDFKHVRVDLYDLPDGRILFSEMTFSSWAGMGHFVPEKWDEVFGNLIHNV